MNKTDEIIEQYLLDIRKAIHNLVPCETFLEGLRQELQEALSTSESCTLEELISQFGDPGTVAQEFLEDTEELHPKKIAKAKKKRNIIIAVLIVVLVASLGYLCVLHSHDQAKAVETIEIVEE